jgi:hypothetical protein
MRDGVIADVLPPLHDVDVVEIRPNWWTLTGFERIADSLPGEPTCCQQSWFLVPILGAHGGAGVADNDT